MQFIRIQIIGNTKTDKGSTSELYSLFRSGLKVADSHDCDYTNEKISNKVSTTKIFGLCTCKWGIFALGGDLVQFH